MTFLRTALVVAVLNLPLHAQPTATAADATALITGTRAFVYMTINNPSMYDLYIVSGKSDAAESVELMQGDNKLESITIPAYGSLEMKPAAHLIRLSGLKGQFKAGDELKLTLETDGGAAIAAAAIIKTVEK